MLEHRNCLVGSGGVGPVADGFSFFSRTLELQFSNVMYANVSENEIGKRLGRADREEEKEEKI